MRERSYRVVLWSLALIGLLADQGSKYGVFGWLLESDSRAYALFQTDADTGSLKRTFATVPADEGSLFGFFLQVDYKRDKVGQPVLDAHGRRTPHVNHGALFGIGADRETWANGAFALISLLAAGAILFWSAQKNTARDRWLCVALGLILAGTLGNFYDRLMFNGVRDFLHWNYGFDWPVFNIADCCLVCGAGLLLVQAFFVPATQPAKEPELAVSASTQG